MRLYKAVALAVIITATATLTATAQQKDARYPIIPYPTQLVRATGTFVVTPNTTIVAPAAFANEAAMLNTFFGNSFGTKLKQSQSGAGKVIRLTYDGSLQAEEGYSLIINANGATISAKTAKGIFMGVQTLRQLMPASAELKGGKLKSIALPAVTIHDQPAYAYRGMHLDVSRHFFSIGYLHKYVDMLALYKFNKLHLHLTDDQGWRVEIKKYPKLTENGAWRTFNNQDTACMKKAVDNPDFEIDKAHIIHKDGKTLYGGFYTQAQLKELVAYAAARKIDIIPEIDMPGHMMAAINEYPYLSSDGKKSEFGELFTKPICPCLPSTFTFAQDVYSEIMDIFPSKYMHIGGDEVDRSTWATSEDCKALMKREGLKNTAELQSYFINNMEKFFNSRGRKLIGWDEVLEGGVTNTAVIMYWRSWVPKAPVEAAKLGNKVIMTPGNPLYFDSPPDKNSIPNVYNFQIIPNGLTADEAKNIIGAQANLWSEYVPTENRADYMIMPRMTALAEVLWTHKQDFASYQQRLLAQYPRLDLMKVHYRLPDLGGFLSSNVFTDVTKLDVQIPLPGLTVHYTTDGTLPDMLSPKLSEPLVIKTSQHIRLAAFKADGAMGDVYDLQYQKQTLAEPVAIASPAKGLLCSEYRQLYKNTTLIPNTKPDTTFTVQSITVPKEAEAPSFAIKYRGYLEIPTDGIYSFYLTCDDGGTLKIAGRDVVNNDGLHAAIEKNGQVALKKGLQPIALDFIEGGGGYTLKLKYSLNGSEPKDIPAEWLKN
ncbi:family 20 glycosylhydrolase [Mucilaginibacter psychrotolerans]|uniref:beta-N-acetylhexosaminidase n=1 Tax=Mucilaginibacter psychrotolerans TaxID=1524096 RepID=A0A4Y8SIP4_9SPHI|nr:family 20 glycosylhydrolase [Mucilaginibacter psychrotolerans]TFF38899.1 beta-hexosaminidase [Mucilaginibacter psychrotolerans]